MKRSIYALAISCAAAAISVSPVDARDPPNFIAVVDPDGTLARGVSAVSASHDGTGLYQVLFLRRVDECAYTASIGLSGDNGTSNPGIVTVSAVADKAHYLLIQTYDLSGNPKDWGFHLIVAC